MEGKLYKLFNKPEYKTVMNEISDFIKCVNEDYTEITNYLEDLKLCNKFADYLIFSKNKTIIIIFDDQYIFKVNFVGNAERICDK